MSEVDFLIEQLEYCINSGYSRASQDLLRELILHKCQIKFSLEPDYTCLTHVQIFNKSYNPSTCQMSDLPCHKICNDCINTYTELTFKRFGLNAEYFCPGCILKSSLTKTRINPSNNVKLLTTSINTLSLTKRSSQSLKECSISTCQEINIPILKLYTCGHQVCERCIIYYINLDSNIFKCVQKDCNIYFPQSYLLMLLKPDSQDFKEVLSRTPSTAKYFNCAKCGNLLNSLPIPLQVTCPCSSTYCSICTRSHPATIACASLLNDDSYRLIECFANDPVPEYKSLFELADNQFKLDFARYENTEFWRKVKRVWKVENLGLEERFEKAKIGLAVKGFEFYEDVAFFGDFNEKLERFCQNGVWITQGNAGQPGWEGFGLGIITCREAVFGLYYTQWNQILMCKVINAERVTGLVHDEGQLVENENRFYCNQENNYLVHFRSDFVLPYLLLEFNKE